jgi:hypothetical protein
MNKKMSRGAGSTFGGSKFFSSLLLIIIVFSFFAGLFLPSLASAQVTTPVPGWTGLVPCGRNSGTAAEQAPCTLCHLVIGFQRLVQYGMYMVVTLALVGIFFAGVMYMVSTGDEGMMTQAKGFLKVSLIGFAVVIAGWLIVNVTMWVLGTKGDLGIGIVKWNQFTCDTKSTQGSGGATTGTTAPTATPSTANSGQKCGLSNDGTCQQGLTCPSGWWAITGSPTNSCPSGQTCCSQGNWPNPPESCSAGDGSCYYGSNFCPSGYHSIIGVCSKANSVCCVKNPYWPNPAESCALGAGKCYFNSNTCPSGFRSIIGVCSIPMSVCCQATP